MGLHCLMVDLSLSKIFKIDEYNKSNFFSYLSLSFCCCRMFQWGSWCNFTVAVRPICQIVIVGRGSWISDPVDVTLSKLRSISSMAGYLSHEDRRVFVSDMNLAHITVSQHTYKLSRNISLLSVPGKLRFLRKDKQTK